MDEQGRARLVLLIFLASPLYLMFSAHGKNVHREANGLESGLTSDPLLFVFGASMVDGGTNAVALPFRSVADFYPYGSDYFGKPVGRWSNGRTFMDILTQSLGMGLLDPFVKSYASNFTHGINFASSGSTALNTSSCGGGGLFSLLVQVDQFREYQSSLLSLQQDSRKVSKLKDQFSNSIYFFETAHNDYILAHAVGSDQAEVVENVIAAMRQAFEALYSSGARNFIVTNVTPLGCTPQYLSETSDTDKDAYNCSSSINEYVDAHNKALDELLSELSSDYASAEWILFDAYNIFLDGYQNPSKYGIKYPFQACCGDGGTYHFNTLAVCGKDGVLVNGTYLKAEKCDDPSLYLIWDSIHPVESFSKYVARGILNNTHLFPQFNILRKFSNPRLQFLS